MKKKMNKKQKIIILVFALIVIGLIIFLLVKKVAFDKEKISEIEIDGKTYYVLNGKYKGEFDFQKFEFDDEFRHSLSNAEYEREVDNLNKNNIFSYDEYVNFCNKWKIKQVYDDSNMNYATVSYWTFDTTIVDVTVGDVVTENNKITIYLYEDIHGTFQNNKGYSLVVPVSKEIKEINVVELVTKEEVKNLKKYGTTYNPDMIISKKPMIYIYPDKDMNVSVKLGNPDYLTTTYPKYNDGWNVYAKKDGTLIDSTGRSYYALYWEGNNNRVGVTSEGFVVKGEDTAKFLEEKLAILGLSEREINEFIIYWLPNMEHNNYNYIRFESEEEIDEYMPLEVTPKPDSIIRVMMVFKALDHKIDVSEQELVTSDRTGYTVVEWGGSEIH